MVNYWDFLKEVITGYSKYNGKKKLYDNVISSNCSPKALATLKHYYKGNPDILLNQIVRLNDELEGKLERFARFCARKGIKAVDREWLETNITDGKVAAKYYGKIKKCKETNGVCPTHPENL